MVKSFQVEESSPLVNLLQLVIFNIDIYFGQTLMPICNNLPINLQSCVHDLQNKQMLYRYPVF